MVYYFEFKTRNWNIDIKICSDETAWQTHSKGMFFFCRIPTCSSCGPTCYFFGVVYCDILINLRSKVLHLIINCICPFKIFLEPGQLRVLFLENLYQRDGLNILLLLRVLHTNTGGPGPLVRVIAAFRRPGE